MPLADAWPVRGRTELGAVVGLYANGVPNCFVPAVNWAYLVDLHSRIVVLAQGALFLGDFPSARIDGRGGTAFRRANSPREVIANALTGFYALPGLVVSNDVVVCRRLTPHSIDVPGRIALAEVIAQRR